jgi:hypothetical protein
MWRGDELGAWGPGFMAGDHLNKPRNENHQLNYLMADDRGVRGVAADDASSMSPPDFLVLDGALSSLRGSGPSPDPPHSPVDIEKEPSIISMSAGGPPQTSPPRVF